MLWTWLRPLLFRIPAEIAHDLGSYMLRLYSRLWILLGFSRSGAASASPKSRRVSRVYRHFGRDLVSPLGLAAGFDKNARLVPALSGLGFGFLEVGTVTPRPQSGNPKPRMFRLPASQGLINRLGFNNLGLEPMVQELEVLAAHRSRLCPIGINLGKNKDTPNEEAAKDYRLGLEATHRFADFFVINLSSPNTPGLRDLLAEAALSPLLREIRSCADILDARSGKSPVPILLKISPDMGEEAERVAVDLAMSQGFAGIVATNTTIRRDLSTIHHADHALLNEAGGLSGKPIAEISAACLGRVRKQMGQGKLLISVGGIDSIAEIERRLDAGADLVELYTGFIYQGPSFPAEVRLKLGR